MNALLLYLFVSIVFGAVFIRMLDWEPNCDCDRCSDPDLNDKTKQVQQMIASLSWRNKVFFAALMSFFSIPILIWCICTAAAEWLYPSNIV